MFDLLPASGLGLRMVILPWNVISSQIAATSSDMGQTAQHGQFAARDESLCAEMCWPVMQ